MGRWSHAAGAGAVPWTRESHMSIARVRASVPKCHQKREPRLLLRGSLAPEEETRRSSPPEVRTAADEGRPWIPANDLMARYPHPGAGGHGTPVLRRSGLPVAAAPAGHYRSLVFRNL